MILCFSGCGNSKFVANELSRLTGDTIQFINPGDDHPVVNLQPSEPLGIVCPVYAWAVPRLVTEYIKRLKILHADTLTNPESVSYCYLACTCGDNVGRTPERLARVLRSKGIRLNAAFSFVMPETYINIPGFHLDSDSNAARKIAAVRDRLPQVAARILNRDNVIDVERGKMPIVNSYILNPLFYGLLITDRKFTVSDDCVRCGKCAEVCQLNNISIEGGRPVWHGNCTNCMACYHHCPSNAIHFGKATKGKGQYVFPSNIESLE